ncbi:MAG: hypothetical protein KBA31_21670 [Alphaproteobacteria bacterium]|nr:hypothetical protein [Alphaproteobacteria bacterium]
MFTALINGFMDLVLAAESVSAVGRAFLTTVGRFGYNDLTVFDLTKMTEPFSSMLVFVQPDAKREFTSFNRRVRFVDHPGVRYALAVC